MYSQEIAAIATVRTLETAEARYRAQFNRCGSFRELAHAGMIDTPLASGFHSGYEFVLTGCTVQAAPTLYNESGSRTFYCDETMVVHEHYGPEPATARDPQTK